MEKDNVLIIDPKLAKKLSTNEAIVLSQIDYRIKKYNNEKAGRKWVYDSIRAWAEDHFTWISESTIKRTFKKLRDKGLLIVDKFNSHAYDKTLWYSIDYEKLNELMGNEPKVPEAEVPEVELETPEVEVDQEDVQIETPEVPEVEKLTVKTFLNTLNPFKSEPEPVPSDYYIDDWFDELVSGKLNFGGV